MKQHRRCSTFVHTISIALALGAGLMAQARAETITAVSWGGSYQEAISKAYFQPASEATGIEIREDTLNGLADVRLQVQSGNPTWDLVELGSHECARAVDEGLLEELDFNAIDPDGIPAELITDHWVGSIFFSTVIAWNRDTVGEEGPQNWAEFWDVDRFPGRRSLYHRPITVLEAALMADGVAPGDLYPLDVDRAFRKMEEIKPHVSVWWQSGGQSAQLAADNEVDLILIFNGRIDTVVQDGGNWDYTFNQGILDYDCYAVPRGSANKDAAMRVIGAMVQPEVMARLPQYINYGPSNAKAFEVGIIPEEMLPSIPSAPEMLSKQVIFNADWWQAHEADVQERWYDFLQQ